jgi:hypothetical protein
MKTNQLSLSQLSWGQRFALIDAYHLTPNVACETMGVTEDELNTALELKEKGIFKIDTVMDTAPFGELFGAEPAPRKVVKKTGPSTIRSSEQKKRGRKGDKITKAFLAVPEIPTPIDEFMTTHGVSLAVLRQSKRFDTTELAESRPVRVKKVGGVLTICRPAAAEANQNEASPAADESAAK